MIETTNSFETKSMVVSESRYYRQLDFLRFFAVGIVIAEHWFGGFITQLLDLGYLGVSIFFTLSGFLISGILLRNKSAIENGQITRKEVLRKFYIRRTLRIFPIYYLLIIFLFVFSFEGIRQKILWYVLYASNIYTYKQQAWDGMIGPLWSLAVEEQFYLVWPLLMLLIPLKRLPHFFLGCLIAAPVFRLISVESANYFSQNPIPHLSMRVLMPNCIDAFAAGGFLAFWNAGTTVNFPFQHYFRKHLTGFILLACSILMLLNKDTYIYYLFFPSVFSWFSVYLISNLITEKKGWMRYVVGNGFFLFLGKISYGLYLYHGPFPLIFSIIDFSLSKVGIPFTIYNSTSHLESNLKHFIWIFYLIVFATLSYYLIEKPFNRLKDKFAY